ncbi:hypothetical protein [Actinophytocola sp. NPDC049390]|uniref:hypothetical protein n=1 Tax=Actinophytocola sp. NPDC049390 TaxID=3363894 RepID=UPI0037B6E77A
MQATFDAALDGLYSAFARRDRPTAIDYCTHCVDPATVKRLLAPVPLREIPAETIRPYTVDVLSTAGGAADFRHFLPRILHIAVTDGFGGYPDLGLVMSKVRRADWRGWPASEQQAVTDFMHAVWSTTLTRFPADPGAEELLGAIGQIEGDLTPYLRTWEAALATHAGASHLLVFVRDTFGRAGREYWLTVPGWPDTAAATVRAWLGDLSGTVAATAEAVTDEETGDVLLELLVSL